jgi:uncharacterized small protein (DUF1192 family)
MLCRSRVKRDSTVYSKQTKFNLASKNDINELNELIVALRKEVDRMKAKIGNQKN